MQISITAREVISSQYQIPSRQRVEGRSSAYPRADKLASRPAAAMLATGLKPLLQRHPKPTLTFSIRISSSIGIDINHGIGISISIAVAKAVVFRASL